MDEKEKLADEKQREAKKQNARIKDIRPVNKKEEAEPQTGSIAYPFLIGNTVSRTFNNSNSKYRRASSRFGRK